MRVDWRIQIDGPTATDAHAFTVGRIVQEHLPSNYNGEVSVHHNGFQAGGAVTRNIGFHSPSPPSSEWILSLDGDDLVMPRALETIAALAEDNPPAYWLVGGALMAEEGDGLPNPTVQRDWSGRVRENATTAPEWGGEVPSAYASGHFTRLCNYKPLLSSGQHAPRSLMDWAEANGRFPLFAAFAAYRTRAVVEVCGWPAVPTGADAALLALVSDRRPGYVSSEPLFVYEQHPGQNTRSTWFARNRRIQWQMVTGMRAAQRD